MAPHTAQPCARWRRCEGEEVAGRRRSGGGAAQAPQDGGGAGGGSLRGGAGSRSPGGALRRAAVGAATFVLGLAVYLVAFATHEVMHLVALYAVGGTGSLVVRPWAFTFLPLTVDSLHAQAAAPLPFAAHLLFDFAGPALAMLLLGILTLPVGGRLARSALGATLAILAL